MLPFVPGTILLGMVMLLDPSKEVSFILIGFNNLEAVTAFDEGCLNILIQFVKFSDSGIYYNYYYVFVDSNINLHPVNRFDWSCVNVLNSSREQ